ncbi:hypothetical protein V500_00294 [Pseudogymnoascus sp. VKM F-4518 (FW-2643)]|nr:hypothetical protein V500_00294 [Pseudogymnoascus sp. VKM F-4518 (FW-2643)]
MDRFPYYNPRHGVPKRGRDETEIEMEKHRERQRQMEKQRQIQMEKHRERQREIQNEKHKERQREIQRFRKELEKEMVKKTVAAAAAAEGPSPAQSLRRGELLGEKADFLKQFTSLNTKIRASKDVAERAIAQHEKDKEEKRRLEEKYSKILAELGRIPAELSSLGGVMLTSGRDIVKNQKVGGVIKHEGGDVTKLEAGNIIRGEGEEVTIKEEEEGDMI